MNDINNKARGFSLFYDIYLPGVLKFIILLLVLVTAVAFAFNKLKIAAFTSILSLVSWFAINVYDSLGLPTDFVIGLQYRFLGFVFQDNHFVMHYISPLWNPLEFLTALPTTLLFILGTSLALMTLNFSSKHGDETIPNRVKVFTPTNPLPTPPATSKKCPECAEEIQVKAIKCRYCGYRYE